MFTESLAGGKLGSLVDEPRMEEEIPLALEEWVCGR
jgi:hypothetical protein